MVRAIYSNWFEKSKVKKQLFRKLYGRRPSRDEIKLLKKNLIELGAGTIDMANTPHHNTVYRYLDDYGINKKNKG